MKSTMQSAWQACALGINGISITTSAIQNREVHQAFFCGALVAFKAMNAAAATNDQDEAQAVQHLEALAKETEEVCSHKAQCARDRN